MSSTFFFKKKKKKKRKEKEKTLKMIYFYSYVILGVTKFYFVFPCNFASVSCSLVVLAKKEKEKSNIERGEMTNVML
jgi:polyferredoxin